MIAAACVLLSGTCLGAMPGLPSAEQQVIEAFLGAQDAAFGGQEQALWDAASAASLDFGGSNATLRVQPHCGVTNLGPAYAQAVADMLEKSDAARVGEITNALRRVHLITASAYRNILRDNDASFDEWMFFYERFPACGRIITVSRVGIDPKGSVAVLYYGLKDPCWPAVVRFQAMRREGTRWVTGVRPGSCERYVCTRCGFQKSIGLPEGATEGTREEISFQPTLVSGAIGANGCQHSWLLYARGRIEGGDYILSDLPGGKPPTFCIHALLSSPKFASELAAMDRPDEKWHQLVTALSTNWALDRSLNEWSTATPQRSYTAWWLQSPLARTKKP
jgi:hypothetical protein